MEISGSDDCLYDIKNFTGAIPLISHDKLPEKPGKWVILDMFWCCL